VLASNTPAAIKALVMDGAGQYAATVNATVASTMPEALKQLIFQGTGDYITTVKAVVDSTLSAELKALLLNSTSTAMRAVTLSAAFSGVLSEEQRQALMMSAETVAKVINTSVSVGSITADQRMLLNQADEEVSKTINALVNNSSLTSEQRAFLSAVSGSSSSTLSLAGTVTFDPSTALLSVFNAIQENTAKMTIALLGGTYSAETVGARTNLKLDTVAYQEIGSSGTYREFRSLTDTLNSWFTILTTHTGLIRLDINSMTNRSGGAEGGIQIKFDRGTGSGPVFADGGVFSNSVVTRPTAFPIGLMGEAGPEAIMPLARTPDGALGVRGGIADRATLAELRAMRAEIEGLRAEARATAVHTSKTSRVLERVTRDGEALQTVALE
jgi:hypothetical protein